MRYVFLIASDPADWAEADEATQQEYFDAHHAFERFVKDKGTHLGCAALCDADVATTVRRSAGADGGGDEVTVTDGPFAELVEQLSGYYDVELRDLDTAIEAAALLPRAYTVEVRPVTVVERHTPA